MIGGEKGCFRGMLEGEVEKWNKRRGVRGY